MIRMKPDGTFEFDTVEEALAFQAKRAGEVAGASAATAIVPARAPAPPGTAGERWPDHRRPKGTITPNGRGFRWQFSLKGMRYNGPTVPSEEEAESGLGKVALDALEASGTIPSVAVDSKQQYVAPPDGRRKRPHGAGSVFHRGGLWSIRWLDETGVRRFLSGIETEERAEQALDEMIAKRTDALLKLPLTISQKRSEAGRRNVAKRWGNPSPASTPAKEENAESPCRRGRPFSGGSVKEMPGGKFRWVFKVDGREFNGPLVDDRATAEAQRLEAVEGVLRGELPPARRAGTVQKNGNGYRWKIERDFRRYLGPTVDTEEEAEQGRPAAVAALDRGEQPATAPKYRSRAQREAARSVTPRGENIPIPATDGERSKEPENIPNNIPGDDAPPDDGFVHRWVSDGGGTAHCASDGHGGRLTRAAATVTCAPCRELGDPDEDRPREVPPPEWILAWLKPEQREAFQAVVLEGVHCRTAAHLAGVSPNVIAGRANSARGTVKRLLAWEAERAGEGIPLTEDDRRPPQRDARDPLLSILRSPQPTEEPQCKQDDPPSVPVESGQPAPSSQKPCRVCGELGHDGRRHRFDRAATKFAGHVCKACGKPGHMAKTCDDAPLPSWVTPADQEELPAQPTPAVEETAETPSVPDDEPQMGGFSTRTGHERLDPWSEDKTSGRRRGPLPPLIRYDLPTEHPVIVDQGGVEVLALDVGRGAERGTVRVRWRIGDRWSEQVDEVVRDAVLREATEDEIENGPGLEVAGESDPEVDYGDAADATG